ncbi:MAG: hypothetical protein ACYTGH_20735 [Planctomycetota bacterium]|jgi:hypothetical protein
MAKYDYYRLSGAAPLDGVLSSLVISLFGGVGLGAVFGFCTTLPMYLTFTGRLINLLVLVGFYLGARKIFFQGVLIGHIRNATVVSVLGGIGGLAALYGAWVIYLCMGSNFDVTWCNPLSILRAMPELQKAGIWIGGEFEAKEGILSVLWLLEALLFVLLSILGLRGRLKNLPFCEECKSWTKPRKKLLQLEPIDKPSNVRTKLEKGKAGVLSGLAQAYVPKTKEIKRTYKYCEVSAHTCPNCPTCYLSIDQVTLTPGEDQGRTESRTSFLKYLEQPRTIVEEIKAMQTSA